ncbi:hypothetical protein DZS_16320 [Dickeya ananatis]|uniref:hypothetical protein n=1 Tax=Dickeya ananatis TaxID=3061286 RepID=UPI003890E40A
MLEKDITHKTSADRQITLLRLKSRFNPAAEPINQPDESASIDALAANLPSVSTLQSSGTITTNTVSYYHSVTHFLCKDYFFFVKESKNTQKCHM